MSKTVSLYTTLYLYSISTVITLCNVVCCTYFQLYFLQILQWFCQKQDSKDLNPRLLANTPQSLNSTNALTILTSSNAPETLECTNAPKNVNSANALKTLNSANAPKTLEMILNNMIQFDTILKTCQNLS